MAKNDPPAPVETLPHTLGPDKAAREKARMALSRLRLWLQGDGSVKLDDADMESLEVINLWLRDGAILDGPSKRLVVRSVDLAAGVLEDSDLLDVGHVIEALERASELIDAE